MIACHRDVMADGQRQPQIIIRAACAHAITGWRMPPVLDVALNKLTRSTQQDLLAHSLRCSVSERQRILQLVAESERAAGLVIAAARKDPAGPGLINQPAVGE